MQDPHEGITTILSKLDENDLFALAKTVTQGLIKVNSKDDAVHNIIKYSPDVLTILRRKLLTKEILFSYIDERNIIVKLPTTKNDLIDKIVEVWNLPRTRNLLTQKSSDSSNNSSVSLIDDKKSEQNTNNNTVNALAEQFSTWFYSMLNSEGIGSEHFYPDSKLKTNLISSDDCDQTVVENDPEGISRALLQIKLQHGLFFNLNVSKEGVQGRMDPHGLVMVLACGTLHSQNACVGVFEQVFALARDPFCDNNWKVKSTELNLRSKNGVLGPPSLCDSELTSNLLALPSS